MNSLDVPDAKKAEKLPEVLVGPMAVAYQNLTKEGDMLFAETKRKLVAVAGLTPTSVGRSLI